MNSMKFTSSEIDLAKQFINSLLDLNAASETSFNDICIHTDGYDTIVEWTWGRPEYKEYKHCSNCCCEKEDDVHLVKREDLERAYKSLDETVLDLNDYIFASIDKG